MARRADRGAPQKKLPVVEPEPDRVAAWVQLARTFTAFRRSLERVLAEFGLTGPQFDVLATLASADGLSQRELAARLLLAKGNLSLVVDNLERQDLVQRRADAEDARVNRVFLTDLARKRLDAIVPGHRAVLARGLGSLDPGEIARLRASLLRIERRLEKGS